MATVFTIVLIWKIVFVISICLYEVLIFAGLHAQKSPATGIPVGRAQWGMEYVKSVYAQFRPGREP
jgi:hypothetical protein